ncbi:hypothetical protein SAMN04487904_10761 [Actinopolyspora lacussalsi subsp. righensis]|uniref:Pentapeptide repeat-containing protein n=1 Tax=Actinopolyspora righensis TaxID=995060 RepID=A0A1I7AHK2_9ACTN|nr:pentapeptide repeat-containing protein [Actinopolyspora righensis]SFT74441.1 hypothetical protein SAMN04487904_10761 [Actinopolyspora righensis]
MEFRELSDEQRMRRPEFDVERLYPREVTFRGEFEEEEIRVSSGECAGAEGSGQLARALVRDTDLSGSRFARLVLSDVRFGNTDLSNASWQAVHARRVEFERSRAIGLRISLESALDVYAAECRFDYAMIHVNKVKGLLVFDECDLRETVFTGDLSNVVLRNCALDDAEFDPSGANGCDLRGSTLDNTRGLSRMNGARISVDQAASTAVLLATEVGLWIRD